MNNDEEEQQAEEDLSLAETYHVPPFNLEKFKANLEAAGLSDPEVLLEAVKKSENIIGVGGNAIVCRIPQVAGYVLKVHTRDWLKNRELTELVVVDDQFPEMNFGQPVASIGMADVLKEQMGVPAGVPYGEVRKSRETGNAVYEIYLKTAAAMPQKSYDQLAELFVFLNESGLIFDPSKSNNILVDSEKDIFNLVDLHQKESDDQPKNSLSYIVISLLDNAYAWKVEDEELEPSSEGEAKAFLSQAYDEVADNLGNTVPVCKQYYIHPKIVESYENGTLIPHFENIYKSNDKSPRRMSLGEYAAWTLLG